MFDIAKLKKMAPAHAEGHICIELKDPITGKVKHKEEGKNYIFPDALMCYTGSCVDSAISSAYLVLSDSTEDIDTTFPYVVGNIIGYGIPSTGSSGLYRGAYSIANQVLAQKNGTTSLRWKFQYDFTTSQAIGEIHRIGLSNQFNSVTLAHQKNLPGYTYQGEYDQTNDGRYAYSCSTLGIVTIKDTWLITSTDIDISAFVGTTDTKCVGYAPMTGKMYIYQYSSTAANRRLYVFSDSTFSTLENTYSPSNISMNWTAPLYIYGTKLFTCVGYNYVNVADFVENTALVQITCPTKIIVNPIDFGFGTAGYKKYIVSLGYYYNSSPRSGGIFDMSTQTFAGELMTPYANGNNRIYGQYSRVPNSEEFIFQTAWNTSTLRVSNPAFAMKKLETPVVKTAANGMTVTYEVEVFW